MGEPSNTPFGRIRRKIVIYADPADQAIYEEQRSRELKAIQRCIDQNPNKQRLEAMARDFPYVEPREPDFKTIVERLTWLDQRDTGPVPTSVSRREPVILDQVSPPAPAPSQAHDLYCLPIKYIHPPTPSLHMPPHVVEYFKLRERLVENRRKYKALLSATECFCAGEWTTGDMASMCQGIYPWSTNSSLTIAAANFAISSLESDEKLRLKRVIRVNGQVVGISIYWLTLEASNDKFYEAVVVDSADHSERVLKYIRPVKYFPEISAHLHHLWGPNS